MTVASDGSLTFNAAGAFNDLAEGQTRIVAFSYDVADEFGAVSTATVTFAIRGANDAPTAVDDTITVGETGSVSGSLLTNDLDVEGTVLTLVEVNGEAMSVGQTIVLSSGAKLTVNADGTFRYESNGAFARLKYGEQASDSFTYTIVDDAAATATGTATITIIGEGTPQDLIGYFEGEWLVGVSDGSSFDSTPWANWSDLAPAVVKHGDFDGDGLMDVVGFNDGAWSVGFSNGSAFVTSSWGKWSPRVWKDVSKIAVGDVDADGDDDVLAYYLGSWWVGLSDGTSFTPERWGGWSDKAWQHISLVDLDADGDADLLANLNGSWWASHSNDDRSDGRFEMPTRWGGWGDHDWEAVGTFDANGDDKTDVYAFSRGKWYVGISDGEGSFAIGLRDAWKKDDWTDAVVGDFNGDGRDDVAARLNGAWWVSLSTPTGAAGIASHWAAWKQYDWQNVTVGDFDGDGHDDIAGRHKFGWWVARSTGAAFETRLWGNWQNVYWVAVTAAEVSNPASSAPMALAVTAQTASEDDALALLWSEADDDELSATLLAL